MSIIALTVVALATLNEVSAQSGYCYDRFGRRYRCNGGGLGYGARIGIGVGIAAGVLLLFLLCGYWKRRALRKRFAHFKPPPLPLHNGDQSQNPYANNPPPPNFQQTNSYGGGPQPPPATYQPSMAGNYNNGSYRGESGGGAATGATGTGDHEHGYEWEQAREQERLEREANSGTGQAPPAYDPTNMPVGGKGYAPPSGPPPK